MSVISTLGQRCCKQSEGAIRLAPTGNPTVQQAYGESGGQMSQHSDGAGPSLSDTCTFSSSASLIALK